MFYKIINKRISNESKKVFIHNYSPSLINLYEFKSVISKLVEEKKFHFTVLNYDVSELTNLKKVTQNHQIILNDLITNYNLDLTNHKSAFLEQKFCLLNLSSVPMSYKAFLELLKYLHETKEEVINNILRDVIEHNYQDPIFNKNIILVRDEWRSCFLPEVLDENSQPVNELNIADKISLEINKNLLNFLI